MADDLLDAHIESFVWTRVVGYDLVRSHGRGLLGGRLYSQLDVPRMRAAGMTGGVFSIATNPFRSRAGRRTTLLANLARLQSALEADPGVAVVADVAGYRRARAEGRMGCFLAVQGGNAVRRRRRGLAARRGVAGDRRPPDPVGAGVAGPAVRAVVPGAHRRRPAEYVAALDARRDRGRPGPRERGRLLGRARRSTTGRRPAIVSHTGVRAVHDVWRNIDDDQIRAIADTGGVVGIMYHSGFLGESSAEAVVRHLEHVVDVGGEDCAALGSDWDGFIVTPRDMRTVTDLPVLLAAMRAQRASPTTSMAKITGANYLPAVVDVRPVGLIKPAWRRQRPSQCTRAAGGRLRANCCGSDRPRRRVKRIRSAWAGAVVGLAPFGPAQQTQDVLAEDVELGGGVLLAAEAAGRSPTGPGGWPCPGRRCGWRRG